ncbi:hypothetical protein BU17DRAFT_91581 [Hysterangium stoloniferum]|nr:hypothetical protein BU17DRAFT_91581 [Hysterangium stoloniferum]
MTAPLGFLGMTLVIHPVTAMASFTNPWSALTIQSGGPFTDLYDAFDVASGFDFWREAKKLGEKAVNCSEKLLEDASNTFSTASEKIHEFKSTIADIVSKTETLRNEVQNEIAKHNLTIEDISHKLSAELATVFEELKTEFSEPLPENKTERYKQRETMISSAMSKIENAFVNCAATWDMSEDNARVRFQTISPQVQKIVLVAGNIIDNHPELIEALLFAGAIFLIPEAWLLRPILGMLGFGPAGPIKGSAAAWAQSRFFGAVVEKGSWFSLLQQAGMKRTLGIIGKAIVPAVGIIGSFLGCWS